MAKKEMETTSEKKAIVVVPSYTNCIDDDSKQPNHEYFYCDGITYDIMFDKPEIVPLALAEQMVRAGRIKNYTITK